MVLFNDGESWHTSCLLLYIHLFVFVCAGSSLLCGLFPSFSFRLGADEGFSLWWLLSLSTGSRAQGFGSCVGSVAVAPGLESTGSVVVARGLSCSTACGVIPDQRLNLALLHWQEDSLPLSHQEGPRPSFVNTVSSVENALCKNWKNFSFRLQKSRVLYFT